MIPRQLIYLVEEYKFEFGLVFYMSLTAALLPLLVTLENTYDAREYAAMEGMIIQEPLQSSKKPAPHIHPSAETTSSAVTATVSDNHPPADTVTAVPASINTNPASSSQTIWPMHGMVTTRYGVSHRPYQDIHTGIDISSAARPGVTAVKSFKDGIVSKVVRSYRGYGNHVIVDHGNSLSSLYAHLSTIQATEGQQVRAGDTLGTEGRTGTATGTHLHFEVLEHGKPVNPRDYIAGNPN